MKKIFLSVGMILSILIAWGYFNIWRSPKFYLEKTTDYPFENILTMTEYGQLPDGHERPYILEREKVLIFGSEHTKNPRDPQIEAIEIAFNQFKPTVVLVEGRLGFLIPYAMNPIERFGEMGKAGELAKKRRIPLYSWDLPKSEQLKSLRDQFDPEHIALKEILNPYFSNLRFGKPDSPEKYVEQNLFRAEWLGVQEKISSIEDIDHIWQRDFPAEKDWRETSDQWGLPGYLAEIGDYANYIRNQHLVFVIRKLIDKGEKVFVLCGSSHAVCIKNEFKY